MYSVTGRAESLTVRGRGRGRLRRWARSSFSVGGPVQGFVGRRTVQTVPPWRIWVYGVGAGAVGEARIGRTWVGLRHEPQAVLRWVAIISRAGWPARSSGPESSPKRSLSSAMRRDKDVDFLLRRPCLRAALRESRVPLPRAGDRSPP